MKHIITTGIVTLGITLGITGCASLENKSVVLSAEGTGLKMTTAVDTSTGTPAPTLWMGLVSLLFIDHQKEDGDLMFYRSQAATLNSNAITTTFVSIKKGCAATVTVQPDSIVSLPGLKVVSGANTINITVPSSSTVTDTSTTADSNALGK